MSHCNAAGCGRQTAGYSQFCSKHAKRNHRHGHHEQQGVTRERLKPHLELVRRFMARRGEALWATLEAVLATALKDAKGIVAERLSGRPGNRFEAAAASEFARVVESVPARSVIETVAAVVILREREPRAFKSDKAAFMQTARRFRSLSRETKRRYVGRRDGRVKTVTRDLHSQSATALGRMLHEALGVIGVKIMQAVDAEHNQRGETRAAAYFALRPGAEA